MKYSSNRNALIQGVPSGKKPFRKAFIPLLAAVLGLSGLWVLGCQSKTPPFSAYPAPNTVNSSSLISNFDTQVPYINRYLFDPSNPPSYDLAAAATLAPGTGPSFTVVNNFTGNITTGITGVGGPGSGATGLPTDYAFHETATLVDRGDFVYPGLDLQAQFEAGGLYDASHWIGVKFMMKVASDDTATHRIFSIPVYQTQAVAGGGGCLAGPRLCYDHFAADYSAGTGGQWKPFNYPFSDLHQLVAGAIPNPPTLSGINLQQVMWLQWEEGRNNSAGSCQIDLWIDDVEFY